MVTNQTAEIRHRYDFAEAEKLAARILKTSPGLNAEVIRSPPGWPRPFASIVFSIDYTPHRIDWRDHQKVVKVALEAAGVTELFKALD